MYLLSEKLEFSPANSSHSKELEFTISFNPIISLFFVLLPVKLVTYSYPLVEKAPKSVYTVNSKLKYNIWRADYGHYKGHC